MITRKSWKEFRESGLLWWINTILHAFGWAIVVYFDKDRQEVIDVYPARVKFRGFSEESNAEGFVKVSKYLNDNSQDLLLESQESRLSKTSGKRECI